jgi:hypothetical protein
LRKIAKDKERNGLQAISLFAAAHNVDVFIGRGGAVFMLK